MGVLGIKALYPKKKRNTSIADISHKKYPYLLKSLEIVRPNQVWASDITYIRLSSGFAYLCAVIDLYTRSILAWRLSFTMDENLTLSVLSISSSARFEKHAFSAGEDALLMYGKPEIFTLTKVRNIRLKAS
jgi:transposase InsO family protein